LERELPDEPFPNQSVDQRINDWIHIFRQSAELVYGIFFIDRFNVVRLDAGFTD
jgi:DNA helicase TIP49 (TBP-interacting protein)